MDNEFNKTQSSLKSKFVDVRIVLTDLEYIEPVSKAVSNFDLSNFNVVISSIIPTNDVELAKTAINGADLVLIAIENSEDDEDLFNAFKKELKSPYNYIEPLNLPSLERLNSYEDNIFEDEIANSIIRGGLFSISKLSSINNAKLQYLNLKDDHDRNILKLDKLEEENRHLIDESKALRDRNEKLNEKVKILQKDLDIIKSDFSDYKSRLESMYVRNSLEVFAIVDLWSELFGESFNENIYKFILLVTDNFRPQNIMVGQGIICAESKDEALDWLKVIKTASILVDENISDLNFKNFSSNLNFEDFDKLSQYQSKLESDGIPYFDSPADEGLNSFGEGLNSYKNDDSNPYKNDGMNSFGEGLNSYKNDGMNSSEDESSGFRNIDFQQDFDLDGSDKFENSDSLEKSDSDHGFNSLNRIDEEEVEEKDSSPYEEINVFKLKNLKKSDKDDSDYDDYDYGYGYDDLDEEESDSDSDDDLEIFSNLWG